MESLRSKEKTLEEKVTEHAPFATVPSFLSKNKKISSYNLSIPLFLKDRKKSF
jgi:hypothetical protein